MSFRTDFADEVVKGKNKEYSKQTKTIGKVKLTSIQIHKENNSFFKEKGNYVSIDFEGLYDKKIKDDVGKLLVEGLHDLHKIKKDDKILIVGLGNSKIIADSLGPMVADKIVVTNHLFKILPENIDKNMKKVCVFTPKVMGQTGLESADLIKSVVKLFTPNLLIVIDALASSSINRINKVIQLSDTGISPGSGVGNYRKEINEKSMGCKVIAIGVATVVEASKLIKEIDKNINIPENDNYNLILTPKEIDEDIEHLSEVIAHSINKYIHDDFKSM